MTHNETRNMLKLLTMEKHIKDEQPKINFRAPIRLIEQMDVFRDVLGIDFQASNHYDPKLELARLFKYQYYEAGE